MFRRLSYSFSNCFVSSQMNNDWRDLVEKFLDERNAAYDTLAKRLLARKSILAYILKYAETSRKNTSKANLPQPLTLFLLMILSTSKANIPNRTVRLKDLLLSTLFLTLLLLLPANLLSSLSTLSRKKLLLPLITN